MPGLAATWLQFVACAAVLAVAGSMLSRYGDVLADKTGISGSWIGLVLLAGVTSLPELVSGVSAVAWAQAPNIAVGDVLGSCVFNLTILVVVDFLHRGESVYRRASQGHVLSAGFGAMMIGLAGFGTVTSANGGVPSLGHIGPYSPVFVAMYLIAVRAVYDYEREQMVHHAMREAGRYPDVTLLQAVRRYVAAAVAVLVAGAWLPHAGVAIAESMGWHRTFVGTLLVAGATSLPELVVTLAAVRIGAVDMAIANLLGSNLFNIAILAVDDAAFLPGPLLAHVSPLHVASAFSAIVMTGIVVAALVYRPRDRAFRAIGWTSFALLVVYLLNASFLYLYSE